MLWIEGVVVRLERHIAGEEMVAFVPGRRLLPNAEGYLQNHAKQERHYGTRRLPLGELEQFGDPVTPNSTKRTEISHPVQKTGSIGNGSKQ